MDNARLQIVWKSVLGHFSAKCAAEMQNNITAAEVCEVILDCVRRLGYFPPNAIKIDGNPPIYCGEQIRRLDEETFVVANVDFFAHSSMGGSSTRIFNNAQDAVTRFAKGCLRDCI